MPNAVAIAAGLALVGLGVYDHDNAALIDVGLATVAGAVGHAAGKQAPPP